MLNLPPHTMEVLTHIIHFTSSTVIAFLAPSQHFEALLWLVPAPFLHAVMSDSGVNMLTNQSIH